MVIICFTFSFQTLVVMNNLAKAYAEDQQYDKAEALVLKTIKLANEIDSDFRAVFTANLGAILLEGGKYGAVYIK